MGAIPPGQLVWCKVATGLRTPSDSTATRATKEPPPVFRSLFFIESLADRRLHQAGRRDGRSRARLVIRVCHGSE